MSTPRLSFLLCNYNDGATLPRAVDALCAEAGDDDQIIVVDDGSTDDSVAILDGYAGRHPRLTVLRNGTNRGLIASSQRALAAADGDYIGLFAADDHLAPGVGNSARALARRFPEAGVLAHDCLIRRLNSQTDRYRFPADQPEGTLGPALLLRRLRFEHLWITTSNAFLRHDALRTVGGWREDLDWLADWFTAYAVALRHGVAWRSEVGSVIQERAHSFGRIGATTPERRQPVISALFRQLRTPAFADLRPRFRAAPLLVLGGLGRAARWDIARRPTEWDFLAALATEPLVRRLLRLIA